MPTADGPHGVAGSQDSDRPSSAPQGVQGEKSRPSAPQPVVAPFLAAVQPSTVLHPKRPSGYADSAGHLSHLSLHSESDSAVDMQTHATNIVWGGHLKSLEVGS